MNPHHHSVKVRVNRRSTPLVNWALAQMPSSFFGAVFVWGPRVFDK